MVNKKRLVCLILAFVMFIVQMPIVVFADTVTEFNISQETTTPPAIIPQLPTVVLPTITTTPVAVSTNNIGFPTFTEFLNTFDPAETGFFGTAS